MNHLIQGEIIEPLKPNKIILALFDTGQGWLVSGIIYRSIDQAQENLAFMNPKRIIYIKVILPDERIL